MHRNPRLPYPRLPLFLALLLGTAVPTAARAQLGGPPPGPLPLFPSDNWWNVDVTSAPVDPRSDDFIDFIGPSDGLHPDFGGDAPSPPGIYGMPYAVVPGNTPLEIVTFVLYGGESDHGAPGRPLGYPIPAAARTQPKWIEGGQPGNVDANGDRHLLLIDRDHRVLFELYQAHWNQGLGRWEAGSGAIFPLDANHRRPEGWTSADAAGLAILPGLVRYDEASTSEPIRHAFRFTVHATNGHVFPASHTAGSTSGAPPLGARLRLRAGKDLSGFPPLVRRIFQAMKTYGLILADNGSDLYVQGTYDTRWNNDVLNPAFASLKARDFEVIQLGWEPAETPSAPAAPTNLRAEAVSSTRIDLDWQDRSNDEDSFSIEGRSTGAFSPIGTVGADVTSFAATNLEPATSYAFRVRASGPAGNSGYSNVVDATTFGSTEPCLADATTLCLNDDRFRVEVAWSTGGGGPEPGQAVPMTTDTGRFWFFTPTNVELVVKVLDACNFNDRTWVFAAGLTNVEVELKVTDTATGAVARYRNPDGRAFQPIQDTGAFATCARTLSPARGTYTPPGPPETP